jgi:hypothetical protein
MESSRLPARPNVAEDRAETPLALVVAVDFPGRLAVAPNSMIVAIRQNRGGRRNE